jgi:hypothetical protein
MTEMELSHVCSCGGSLSIAWGGSFGYNGYILRCAQDVKHSDFVRPFEPSISQNPDIPGWKLTNRRKRQLEQQVGNERNTQLMRYQGQVHLSKDEAERILRLIWPEAMDESPDAVARAVMICVQYHLNPLMKHLYLLPFRHKEKSKKAGRDVHDWEPALGIGANRLLARRQGPYSYVDNTPRMMTDQEQRQIHGKVDPQKLWAITKLRDKDGMDAQGYGFWPKDTSVYGDDKGNTPEGMAMIRSERQALDRKYPDSLPGDVIVVDENYLAIGSKRVIDVEARIDAAPTPAPAAPTDPPKPEAVKQAAQVVETAGTASTATKAASAPAGLDMDWVRETLKEIRWSDETTKSWLGSTLKVVNTGTLAEVLGRLNKEQVDLFVKELQSKSKQLPFD